MTCDIDSNLTVETPPHKYSQQINNTIEYNKRIIQQTNNIIEYNNEYNKRIIQQTNNIIEFNN